MSDDQQCTIETASILGHSEAISGDLLYIAKPLRSLSVPIDSVSFDPANARTHSPRNIDVVKGSLKRFGQVKPIVIDEQGVVLAGNGTLQAAKELGWSFIAAVRVGFTDSIAAAYAIADNRSAELAQWDEAALANLLQSLTSEDDLLAATGFNQDEVVKLIQAQSGAGELPADAAGRAYDESAADDVKKCPHCGFPL